MSFTEEYPKQEYESVSVIFGDSKLSNANIKSHLK